MSLPVPSIAILASFAVPLAAQTVISPAPFAKMRGGQETIPLGLHRQYVYQQIHGDLRNRPLVAKQLSFRQGGASPFYTARTVDVEIFVGQSDYAKRSVLFSANFKALPTKALPRRKINLPDWTRDPVGGYPAPFTATFAFVSPYIHTGASDLCWQMTIHDNSAQRGSLTLPYGMDKAAHPLVHTGATRSLGRGCRATGQRNEEMKQFLTVRTYRFPPRFELFASFQRGVENAPSAVYLSTINPNFALPGLCTRLHVAPPLLATWFGKTIGNTGMFYAARVRANYVPALVGTRLYAQGTSIDPKQPGIPLAVTDGRETIVPSLPPRPVDVCQIYHARSASATIGLKLVNNQGVVVEFR